MKTLPFYPAIMITALAAVLINCSCLSDPGKDHHKKEKADAIVPQPKEQIQASSTTAASPACDPSLWKYVYNPERLQILDSCKTVTGTIEESNADEDGDQHMLLKLDAGQENLLTERNMKKKEGDLVIEAVCINAISRKKVGDACTGYINKVQLPAVGDHVSVSGSYVIDSHNGWAEIHPITKVELKKN